ncbi:MAG: sugar phosphate isomerase/epimerase family protein [Thermoguttaceae bacterium]
MALLSINEATTFRWSFEQDVTHYAAAGVPAIGVWRQKLSHFGEAKGIELLEETGLKVSHLFWAGGFTGSDGRSFRASVEDAAEALRTAASLGTGTLLVYSGARAGHTYNHARRLFKDALVELSPLAVELNVVLAVEPMHAGCAGDFTFLTSLDDALAFLDSVDSPAVKLVLDTYHLGFTPDLAGRIGQFIDRVALVQLADAKAPPAGDQDRSPLGEGVLPLAEIVDALTASGYDGFYDVELLGEQVESLDYQALLSHAREAFARLLRPR